MKFNLPLILAQAFILSISSAGLSLALQTTQQRAPVTSVPASQRDSNNPSTKKSSQSLTVHEVDAAGLRKLLPLDSPANAKQEGSELLLVNFWATWCVPCREEFPDLVGIDKQYQGRGLKFITVSLDDVADIRTDVPQFLSEMRSLAPAYLLNTPEPDTVISRIDPTWGGGLPATFLFDKRGQLVFKHMGRVKAAELRAAIEKTMNAKR